MFMVFADLGLSTTYYVRFRNNRPEKIDLPSTLYPPNPKYFHFENEYGRLNP